jgi:iron complex transport system substrate-binding protein
LKIPKILKISTKWRKKLFGVILISVMTILFIFPIESFSSGGFNIYVTDDMGETITLQAPVSRIVSLYAGHTENLIAIGAGGLIVAIGHEGEDLGLSVPVLGQKPWIERIMALGSDMVLTRPMIVRSQEPFYGALKSMGIKVLAFDPPAWDGFPEYIDRLRLMAGVDETPKYFTDDAVKNSDDARLGRGIGVFLVTNGRTMATCTADSWAAHIMRLAGFRNAAAEVEPMAGGSVIAGFGAERLLAADAEIDAILLQQGAMNTLRAEDFTSDPRFKGMRAVRNGMVFDVSEADISRPSLLRLENGIVEALRDLVYSREAVQ